MNGVGAAAWRDLLDRHPPRHVETAAGAFSIREAGNGPVVVLLHGIGSGSGSWVHQIDRLSRNFRVIAWDAPGYGDSDPLPDGAATADIYAASLAAVLEAASVTRAVIVGHSLGALIAARFAIRYPDRICGLVLADPAVGHARLSEGERRARREARLKPFVSLGPERFARERASNLLAPDAAQEKVALVRWNMERLTLKGLGDAASLLAAGDLFDDVAAISGPAIVMCGAEDRVTPPAGCREVAAGFPETRPYHEIPGAGHASYIDAPDAFASLVHRFAERCA